MNLGKKTVFILILVVAVFVSAGVYGTRAEAQTKRLSIGTADTGGVYYIYGGGVAKVISSNIPNTIATAEVTPGAVDNVKMLQNNSLDLAFTKSDIAAEGYQRGWSFCKYRQGSGAGDCQPLSGYRSCGCWG